MATESSTYDLTPGSAPGTWAGTTLHALTVSTAAQRINAAGALTSIFFFVMLSPSSPLWFVPALMAATTGLVLGLTPWNEDERLADWLAVQGNWIRWRNRREYTSDGPAAGIDSSTGQPLAVEPPPEIGEVTWIRHTTPEGQELGIVRHEASGRTVAWLEVQPPASGESSDEDESARCIAWNTLQHRFANAGLSEIIIEIVDVAPASMRPPNPWDERPTDPGLPPQLQRATQEAVETAAETLTYRTYFGAVIPASNLLERAVRARGGGDEGLAAVVSDELDTMRGALEQVGYSVLGPLSVEGLMTMLRWAYDPDIQVLPPGVSVGVDVRYAYPPERAIGPNHVEAGGWFTSVHEVKYPWSTQLPGFQRDFQTVGEAAPRAHVLMKRLIPTAKARTAAERERHVATAITEGLAARGEDLGTDVELATDAATRRARRVAKRDVAVATVEYVLVRGRTLGELDDHERFLSDAASATNQQLVPLVKDHHRGILVATPLGVGLR